MGGSRGKIVLDSLIVVHGVNRKVNDWYKTKVWSCSKVLLETHGNYLCFWFCWGGWA